MIEGSGVGEEETSSGILENLKGRRRWECEVGMVE